MAQYDVFENINKLTVKQFPYLLEVQSDVFEDSSRAVFIPLIDGDLLKAPDKALNAVLRITDQEVRLFPLDIASARRDSVGAMIVNVRGESDSIIAALDLLLARY